MSVTIQSTDGKHPSTQEIEDATVIFDDALGNENSTLALCDGNRDLAPLLGQAIILAGVTGGRYHSATDTNGTLVGYAVASPPGASLFGSRVQDNLLGALLSRMSPRGVADFYSLSKVQFPKFVQDNISSVSWLESQCETVAQPGPGHVEVRMVDCQPPRYEPTDSVDTMENFLTKIRNDAKATPGGKVATIISQKDETKFYTEHGFTIVAEKELTAFSGTKFTLWLLKLDNP